MFKYEEYTFDLVKMGVAYFADFQNVEVTWLSTKMAAIGRIRQNWR